MEIHIDHLDFCHYSDHILLDHIRHDRNSRGHNHDHHHDYNLDRILRHDRIPRGHTHDHHRDYNLDHNHCYDRTLLRDHLVARVVLDLVLDLTALKKRIADSSAVTYIVQGF